MSINSSLAERIVTGLLTPALAAHDWRERWKLVNRAAGVIVGWAFAGVESGSVPHVAERTILDVEARFLFGHAASRLHSMIAVGLRERVAETLVQLEEPTS